MSLIRIDYNPSRSQLIVFAAIWLVFFGVIGAILFARSGATAAAIAVSVVAVAVPAIGLAVPEILRIVYVGMALAAFPIGWVVSHVVLAVVFYALLTPIGLLMRVVGYDPMRRRLDDQAGTYWIERPPRDDVRSYFRQF